MADNRNLAALSGNCAADEVTYSGDTAVVQLTRHVHVTGAEGAKTVVETVGTAGSPAAGVQSVQGIASGTPLNVTNATASTATLANVAASVTSVTLQASNANRRGLHIINDSTARLYVKYGSAASATSFTYYLEAAEAYRETQYTGIVTGIWATATGFARLTELTA